MEVNRLTHTQSLKSRCKKKSFKLGIQIKHIIQHLKEMNYQSEKEACTKCILISEKCECEKVIDCMIPITDIGNNKTITTVN